MKLSTLLSQREALLRRTRLANLAFAHATLGDFARRLERAGLRGSLCVQAPRPEEDRFCASLHAEGVGSAVVEEHFTDEYLTELSDVLGFVMPTETGVWRLTRDEVALGLPQNLERELRRAGVELPSAPLTANSWRIDNSRRGSGA